MNISKDNVNGVKNVPGVNVTSCIVPCTDEDNYPTHDSFYGKGGWREVRTINDRDAIPMERRALGMAVSVTQENKVYILKHALNNHCWYEFNPSDASSIINEAIANGSITIDTTSCVRYGDMEELLADYATSSSVDGKISDAEQAIIDWVEQQNFLTEHQSLEVYATKEEVSENVANIEEEINNINENVGGVSERVDTLEENYNNFVSSTNDNIEDLSNTLTAIEETLGGGDDVEFATKEALDELTEQHQEDYATLRDNLSVVAETYQTITNAQQTYSTKAELSNAVDALRLSISGFVSSSELPTILENSNFVTKRYLRGYATEFYVQDYVAEAMAGTITPGKPLVNYAEQIAELRAQIDELTERLNNLTN